MSKPLTDRIEHVVVLMFENRSFDNVLGGLYPELTRQGRYRGLLGDESNPCDPADPAAGSVTVFQAPPPDPPGIVPYPDPGELFDDMVQQIYGADSVTPGVPPMSGFAWSYRRQPAAPAGHGWPAVSPVAKDIMQYYSRELMPVSSCLAAGYAVCDAWFAAAPVQTLANRVFIHCGTPSRLPGTNDSRVNNPDFTKGLGIPFHPPVPDTTIFQLLDDTYPDGKAACGKSAEQPLNWKVYYHDVPLSVLCDYVYDRWCFLSLAGGNVFRFDELIGDVTHFEADVRDGMLPRYSFIEPRYSDTLGGTVNSNHPGGAGLDFEDPNGSSLPPPVDVVHGEQLLWEVYSILLKYPEVFDKTLLVVTYDEHGGLYDHVPPGPAVSPFDPPVDNFDYDRYGVRVPAILINPGIAPGTVYPPRQPNAPVPDPPFDHTSVARTLIDQFELQGSLTPRVGSAPPLAGLISAASHPPPPCSPPSVPAPAADAPPPARPPVTNVPQQALTLGGALAPLYQIAQSGPPGPRR